MPNVSAIATLPHRYFAASRFRQRRVIECGRSFAARRAERPARLFHLRMAAGLAAVLLPVIALLSSDVLAQGTLSGLYKANGKPAALMQVTAHKGEPESGKPVTVLVFTTKDQGNDPKAGFNALFGKYGDAVVVKVFSDGKIYSTDVRHSALDLGPVPSATVFDAMQMKDFKAAGGELSGRVVGQTEIRGTPLEIDLTFKARAP